MKKLLILVLLAFGMWKLGLLSPKTSMKVCHCEKCTCVTCECKPCSDGKCTPCKCPSCKKNISEFPTGDTVNGPAHDGREVTTDLPVSQHLKNKGGSDGAGLCVFTSLDHAGRWQNDPVFIGFRDFMTHYPGGGYPEKVDTMTKRKADGLPANYVQFTDGDPKPLFLALHTGRMPCITYGYSPRYGQNIAHMVNLLYLDEKWACILDNNFPGTYEWVEYKEFLRRWRMGGGGWSVVLLNPSAPPVPHN